MILLGYDTNLSEVYRKSDRQNNWAEIWTEPYKIRQYVFREYSLCIKFHMSPILMVTQKRNIRENVDTEIRDNLLPASIDLWRAGKEHERLPFLLP